MAAIPACGWLMVVSFATTDPPQQPYPAADRAADPAPSRELLLYLAEFEDADGQWVDPMAVADTPTHLDPPHAAHPRGPDPQPGIDQGTRVPKEER